MSDRSGPCDGSDWIFLGGQQVIHARILLDTAYGYSKLDPQRLSGHRLLAVIAGSSGPTFTNQAPTLALLAIGHALTEARADNGLCDLQAEAGGRQLDERTWDDMPTRNGGRS